MATVIYCVADWLRHGTVAFGLPDIASRTSNASYPQSGIVFFKNFHGTGNQGDHIDLWNGNRMPSNLNHDYFKRSEEVWFWNV